MFTTPRSSGTCQLDHRTASSASPETAAAWRAPAHHVRQQQRHHMAQQRHRSERSVIMQQSGGENVVVSGLVSAMTESLRALGVGKQQYQQITQQSSQKAPLAAGDVQGVIERIRQDYQQAYFVTGVIDDSIYDQGCTFVDPTVQFSGLDLWKRNLQLLVPFLIQPRIELMSICSLGPNSEGFEQIQAEWSLDTVLSLPWRPRVSILGSTIYTLNGDANQVVRHVESWNVSAWQALLQIVTPGSRQ